MQIVSPLERSAITSSDRVLFEIQRAIVEGGIAAGSKISEPELARRFNVSRAPLREALARLERCHLIERIPNAGARVVTLSPEGLISLYQIREELEGLACRLAAEQMPENEIDELRQLLDKHLETQRVREGESYYQEAGDLDFHYRIILGSKNQYLINMLCDELYYLVRMNWPICSCAAILARLVRILNYGYKHKRKHHDSYDKPGR